MIRLKGRLVSRDGPTAAIFHSFRTYKKRVFIQMPSPTIWLDMLRPLPSGRNMVIITGMQKSGTTAIAKLLGLAVDQNVCSDPFHKLYEMNFSSRDDLFAGRLSLGAFWRIHRRILSGPIVKDADFASFLPQIRSLFQAAQFVYIVRDPRDTIRSILNRLGLQGNAERTLPGILWGNWQNLLSGRSPEIPGENYVDILAWRWRVSAEAYFGFREHCILVRYEDFKKDKAAEIFRLARKLGYSRLSNIDEFVDVQYQPKGDSAIKWRDFFGKVRLESVEQIVLPHLGKFGYELIPPPGEGHR